MLNRLRHTSALLDSKKAAVHGKSMAKAVADIMKLSSGLKHLEYVLVCTIPQIVQNHMYIYNKSRSTCIHTTTYRHDQILVHELYMLLY